MSVLGKIAPVARGVNSATQAPAVQSNQEWQSALSFEMLELENLAKEFSQGNNIIYSIESLTTAFFQKETVTEYEAHLYQSSMESLLIGAGLDLPVSAIVPSFESAEAAAGETKEKAEEKSGNVIQRVLRWLGELFRKFAARIKSFFGGAKEEGAKIEKNVADLKKKADQVFKHAELTHDANGAKGVFHKVAGSGIKEKNAAKHGTMDTSPQKKTEEPPKKEDKPEAKPAEAAPVKTELPKTVKVSPEVVRSITDASGNLVDLPTYLKETVQNEVAIIKDLFAFMRPVVDAANITKLVGPSNKETAGSAKELIGKLNMTGGKREFKINNSVKVVLSDETRKSGAKFKVKTEYANNSPKGELPLLDKAAIMKALNALDEVNYHGSATSLDSYIDRLEQAAKKYEELSKTVKTRGDGADAKNLREIGQVIISLLVLPAAVSKAKNNSLAGVVNMLYLQLAARQSRKFF